jgi:hypothetical protein
MRCSAFNKRAPMQSMARLSVRRRKSGQQNGSSTKAKRELSRANGRFTSANDKFTLVNDRLAKPKRVLALTKGDLTLPNPNFL